MYLYVGLSEERAALGAGPLHALLDLDPHRRPPARGFGLRPAHGPLREQHRLPRPHRAPHRLGDGRPLRADPPVLELARERKGAEKREESGV